jgi:hypothetical protein
MTKDELAERRSKKELETITDTGVIETLTTTCADLYSIGFNGDISQEITMITEDDKTAVFQVSISRIM